MIFTPSMKILLEVMRNNEAIDETKSQWVFRSCSILQSKLNLYMELIRKEVQM